MSGFKIRKGSRKYLTVSEQEESILGFPEINQTYLQHPRVKIRLCWYDALSKPGNGTVYQYPTNAMSLFSCMSDYFPAFQDINKFEGSIKKKLKKFSRKYPAAIHRMGYFNSYGKRDLTIFDLNGRIISCRYTPEGTMMGSYKMDKAADMDSAIKKRSREMFMEAPDALFLVHYFGRQASCRIDDDLLSGLNYKRVSGQIATLDIPPEQKKNVDLLAFLEPLHDFELMNSIYTNEFSIDNGLIRQLSNISTVRRAFIYAQEKDPAQYWLIVTAGNTSKVITALAAINNRRGIKSSLEKFISECPDSEILVHRMGSELDFGLADKIRDESSDRTVERTGVRQKI